MFVLADTISAHRCSASRVEKRLDGRGTTRGVAHANHTNHPVNPSAVDGIGYFDVGLDQATMSASADQFVMPPRPAQRLANDQKPHCGYRTGSPRSCGRISQSKHTKSLRSELSRFRCPRFGGVEPNLYSGSVVGPHRRVTVCPTRGLLGTVARRHGSTRLVPEVGILNSEGRAVVKGRAAGPGSVRIRVRGLPTPVAQIWYVN